MTNTTPDATGLLSDFKQRMMSLRMIHLALVMGALMFGAVVMFMKKGHAAPGAAAQNPMIVVAAVMAVLSIGLASAMKGVFRKQVGTSADSVTTFEKYQVFILVRAAILEGGGLFSAVCALITSHTLPLILFAGCVVALALFRPSQQEFVEMFDPRRS